MSGFVYSEKPIRIERGEGPYLYTEDGTEYLDVGASYACTPVGHCHPDVVDAVTEEAKDLFYVQASYPVDSRDKLYNRLAAIAPGSIDNVWLCNSGTEANEAALKFARAATGREKIIATKRGFHGRTMGALATTWKKKYKHYYEPLMDGVEFVDYGDVEQLEEAVDEDTAAMIVEPVQGEGGIYPASAEYVKAAREITEEAGAALIADEIQTGLGRTGKMWACEHAGIVPDILTSAKGIASGLPMGATLVQDWVAENHGNHGSTFSGGPVISAAAAATLDVIVEEDLPGHAAEIGEYLAEELGAKIEADEIDARRVRGKGLMLGIEVKRGSNRLVKNLALKEQVLALPAGRTVLRLLPPLTIDKGHADQLLKSIDSVMGGADQ